MDFDKHFVPVDDGSLPGTEDEQRHLFSEWSTFNLDRYYAYLVGLTPETTFIPVDPARLLRALATTKQLDTGDAAWLADIEAQLDRHIAALGGVCFVKLSTRSPKDAVDKPDADASDAIRAELAALLCRNEYPSPSDLVAALKAGFGRALCVSQGARALRLFSLSNRIISDLIRWKKLFVGPDAAAQHPLSIVVRQFRDIPLHSELRCFVYERRLTCATQYFTELFFDELQGNTAALVARLRDFVDRIVTLLPAEQYRSFIVDVSLPVRDGDGAVPCVIELNPFGRLTGAGLFDFDTDADVLHGRAPFELRVCSTPPAVHLSGSWKTLVDDLLVELGSGAALEQQFDDTAIVAVGE